MATFTMTHEIDCDVPRFWKLFLDREFTTRLYEYLAFPKYEIVEQRETDAEVVRVVKATPKLDMPGPVAKALGPGFSYMEEGRFDKAAERYKFVIKPSALEGKLKNEGTVRVEPVDGGKKTRRIVDVVAEAKVFGIGGMLEKMTEKSFRDGWGKGAEFMNDWLKKHP